MKSQKEISAYLSPSDGNRSFADYLVEYHSLDHNGWVGRSHDLFGYFITHHERVFTPKFYLALIAVVRRV
jgi:hypothetical protein